MVNPQLHTVANEPFAYLTTIGRASGKPHRIEIWFADDDGDIALMAGGRDRSDWVRNIKTNPAVTIEIADQVFHGQAKIVDEEDVADPRIRQLLVQKYQKGNELASWGKNSLPVTIRLQDQ